jgi:hypothetical protein
MYMNKINSSKFENFICFGPLILFLVLFLAPDFWDGPVRFWFFGRQVQCQFQF